MISIRDVWKRYGEKWAVRGVSIDVPPGEIFGFLGPNGAGKTTTIKVAVGLQLPTKGTVVLGGRDIVREPTEAKRLMGYVPDRPNTYEKLRGRELLEFIGGLHGIDEATQASRAAELLAMFNLTGAAEQLIESYSHGMRQKLILCAALIHDPPLLVVDEPMVGLDPRGARQLRKLFTELAARGKAILVSTHSLPFAEEVCTRIGIIKDGEIVAVGTREELRGRTSRGDATLEAIFMELTEDAAAEEA